MTSLSRRTFIKEPGEISGDACWSTPLVSDTITLARQKLTATGESSSRSCTKRRKQIVSYKRTGTLAVIALIAELSKLAEEVVRLAEESKLPLRDQIAKAVWERCPDIKTGQSDDVADAILAKANEWCFENWFLKEDVHTALYREFTIMLAGKFGNLGLHGKGKDFVDRCIGLLKRARYIGKGPGGGL